MEYIGFIFGIFGIIAYGQVSELKKRLREVETQLAKMGGNDFTFNRDNLVEIAKGYIGRSISFDFKDEDDQDLDMALAKAHKGLCRLKDVDEDWLLVHIEYKKVNKLKLIRLDTVAGISAIEE